MKNLVFLLVVGILAGTAHADSCNPFGNTPRPLVPDVTPVTCAGGTMMASWGDSGGTSRRACLYEPASASAATPLPLIVYIHPSLFTADTLEAPGMNLLSFQNTADLSGDPARPGFI